MRQKKLRNVLIRVVVQNAEDVPLKGGDQHLIEMFIVASQKFEEGSEECSFDRTWSRVVERFISP